MYVSPSINLANVGTLDNQTTLLTRLSAGRALGLDYLDQYVSSAEARKIKSGGPGLVTLPDGNYVPSTGGVSMVYGGWTQLVAAAVTALRIVGFYVEEDTVVPMDNWGEFQIGIGAGGAEVVQSTLPLPVYSGTALPGIGYVTFPQPLTVAAGVRVAWRSRAFIGGRTFGGWLYAVDPANFEKWSA